MGVWNDGIAPRLTWAQLKALSPSNYTQTKLFFVTDVGYSGSYWYSNGTKWVPLNGTIVLYAISSDVAHSGAATTEKLAEITIPAGLIQNGDLIETHISVDTTNTSSSGSFYHKLGTTGTFAGDTTIGTVSQPSSTNLHGSANKRWKRVNSTTLRLTDIMGAGGLGTSGTAALVSTTVVDLDTNITKLGIYFNESTGGVRVSTMRNCVIELISGN